MSSSTRLPLLDTTSTLFSIDDGDDDESTPTSRDPPPNARPALSTAHSSSSGGGRTQGYMAPYSDDADRTADGPGESVELRSVSPMYGSGLRSTVQSRELGASLPLLPSRRSERGSRLRPGPDPDPPPAAPLALQSTTSTTRSSTTRRTARRRPSTPRRRRRCCTACCRGAVRSSSTARSRARRGRTAAAAARSAASCRTTHPSGSREAAAWSAASPTCESAGLRGHPPIWRRAGTRFRARAGGSSRLTCLDNHLLQGKLHPGRR